MPRPRWWVALGVLCAIGAASGCVSDNCLDPQPVPPGRCKEEGATGAGTGGATSGPSGSGGGAPVSTGAGGGSIGGTNTGGATDVGGATGVGVGGSNDGRGQDASLSTADASAPSVADGAAEAGGGRLDAGAGPVEAASGDAGSDGEPEEDAALPDRIEPDHHDAPVDEGADVHGDADQRDAPADTHLDGPDAGSGDR